MKKKAFLILTLTVSSMGIIAQTNLSWKQLADVDFEMRYFKEVDMKLMAPVFGKIPKAHEEKEITISGYLIPLDVKLYALSKNSYAACFFCGGAGPETIVELQLKPEAVKRYKMDQWMTFKGILRLNSSDLQHFIYILEMAEPISIFK